MLGLSTATDRPAKSLALAPAGKSFRFAEKNIGRFHTSGISGSMKKETKRRRKENKEDDQRENEKTHKPIQTFAPKRIEVRQQEIEEDTRQLLELEAKLAEVKRQKEIRAARAEARQRKRIEYESATRIQKIAENYLTRRAKQAVQVIIDFIRVTTNQQALAAACWAARVIRKFALQYGVRFRDWLQRRKTAQGLWETIQKSSCQHVLATRDTAKQLLEGALGMGIRTATLCLSVQANPKPNGANRRGMKRASTQSKFRSDKSAASLSPYRRRTMTSRKGLRFYDPQYRHRRVFTDGYKNPANKMDYSKVASGEARTPSRMRSPPPSRSTSPSNKSPKRSPRPAPPERGLSRIQSSPAVTAHSKHFVNPMNVPSLPPRSPPPARVKTPSPDTAVVAIPTFVTKTVPASAPPPAAAAPEPKREVGDEEDDYEREKAMRLAFLHRQREEEIEAEREARLKIIEEQKRAREMHMRESRIAAEQEEKRKEKLKKDFLRRIVNEQTARARAVNAMREAKEKKAQMQLEAEKADREIAKNEMKLMFAEDVRYQFHLEQQRRRNSVYGKPPALPHKKHPGGDRGASATTNTHTEGVEEPLVARSRPSTARRHQEDDTQCAEAVASKKPKIPKASVVQKKAPELTEEEKELIILEKEYREREKAKQLAASKAALKQRLLTRKAQENEEKEKALVAEEIKKKEKEMLSMKAALLVQRGIQKKQEMMRARKKAKADLKSSKRKETNSAGIARKPIDAAPSGSAPASSERQSDDAMKELDWIPDDPLGDIGTAQMWDWHKDTPLTGPPPENLKGEMTPRLPLEEGSLIKADNDDEEQPGAGDVTSSWNPCDDKIEDKTAGEKGESEERPRSRTNSAKNRIAMLKDLASSTPSLPVIDKAQRNVLAPSGKMPKKLPAKLANSPFATAGSKSRPNLPVCKGPTQTSEREAKKLGKVASLMSIVDKARESLSLTKGELGKSPMREPDAFRVKQVSDTDPSTAAQRGKRAVRTKKKKMATNKDANGEVPRVGGIANVSSQGKNVKSTPTLTETLLAKKPAVPRRKAKAAVGSKGREEEEGSHIVEAFFKMRRSQKENEDSAPDTPSKPSPAQDSPVEMVRGSALDDHSVEHGSSLEDRSCGDSEDEDFPAADPYGLRSPAPTKHKTDSTISGGSRVDDEKFVSPIQMNASSQLSDGGSSSTHVNGHDKYHTHAAQRYANPMLTEDEEEGGKGFAQDAIHSRCDESGDRNYHSENSYDEHDGLEYDEDFEEENHHAGSTGNADDDNDGDDGNEITDEEKRLNLECENLRARLEEKIFAAQCYMDDLAADINDFEEDEFEEDNSDFDD